jgi:hypothetical protein
VALENASRITTETPPENAGDCQRTGERQPGNSETTGTPGSYRPGDCWRYRPGVTAWPGGTQAGKLAALGSWPDHTGERKPGSCRPGNCWRYCPGVTAWPGGRQPENSETTRTPEALRRAGAALGDGWPDHTGERKPGNVAPGPWRTPETAREPANASRETLRCGPGAASRGTLRLPERRGRHRERQPGSCRPGDGWRYCPSVTAWPGETPETAREPANASRETLRPGRATARTPGTAGAIVQA